MSPSIYDLQDTLNTMKFAKNSGKVRSMTGLKQELDGLRRQHTLLVDDTPDGLAIVKSELIFANANARRVDRLDVVPSEASLALDCRAQLQHLRPTHVKWFLDPDFGFVAGFGLVVSDGTSARGGRFWSTE